MKLFKCSTCDKILEEKYVSNHPASKITWLNATEHEERKKKVDDLQENKSEENKEKKVNDLATLKAKLHDLEEKMKDIDDDELNDLLESLRADMDELEKLKPNEQNKDRDTKQASVEFIGVDTYHSVRKDGDDAIDELVTLQSQRHRNKKLKHSQSYNVLTLTDSNDSVNADELFIKQGSAD